MIERIVQHLLQSPPQDGLPLRRIALVALMRRERRRAFALAL